MISETNKQELKTHGYTIIDDVFSEGDITAILHVIDEADSSKATFRKTAGLYAIRQFLKEVRGIAPVVFTDSLKLIIEELFGTGYFVVKSIYFDKPEVSNWFVAYHQDLTIAVKEKVMVEGYGPWTVKQDQFAVQPPLPILENNFTIRIHLDDTDEQNGALKVVPGSHLKGIYRPETIDWDMETEDTCRVGAGGIMLMKPLLLHASGRTTNGQKRRVMHIEFSNCILPDPFQWAEMSKYETP